MNPQRSASVRVLARYRQLARRLAPPAAALLVHCGVSAQDDGTAWASAQRVLVTGSAVPRIDRETPQPVQVITAEDLRNSGRTSIQDVLRDLTANGQGALSQSFPGSFAGGASGISLRGLNVGATLVLIDGHRMAPYPIGDDAQRAFVDIANLPFDAVERIEVLKDSGSAAYGSDAIAGVVNIILKRSIKGTTVAADVGTSQHGGGTTRRVAATTGFGDLASTGHDAWIAAEYRRQDRILFADRGSQFTRTDYRALGGDDATLGTVAQAFGGLPLSGTGYVTDDNGNIVGFMPGCNAAQLAADQCTYRDTWHEILPQTENLNLSGRYNQRLGGDWHLSVQGSLFVSKAEQILQPAKAFASGYQGLLLVPGQAPQLVTPVPPTTIPSTNPSFPTGTGLASGHLRYTFLDLGGRRTKDASNSTRLVADLQGQLGEWGVSLSLGTTGVALEQTEHNFVDAARLQQALDRNTDPYLVGGSNSASVLAFIAPQVRSHDKSQLAFAEFGGTRDVARLPGGAMTLSVGADYVHRGVHAVLPPNQDYYSIGRQDVLSLHAETVAPVSRALELDASARYDHDGVTGGRVSPQAGFKFGPVPGIAFVGTASRGYRSPAIEENGNAALASVSTRSSDPILCADGNPTTPGNFPSQCDVQQVSVQGSNKTLRPETSTSFTLGTIFEPVKDVGGRIDLWSLQVRHQIVTGSTSQTVRGNNFSPIEQVQPDGSTALVVPPVAPIAYQLSTYINGNSTRVQGVDLELHAAQRVGDFGNWTSGLTLTYIQRYDMTIGGITYRLAGTHGPSFSGDTGNPRTRLQWNNALSVDAWTVSTTINYVGSYGVTDPSAIAVFGAPETTCLDALTNSGGQAGTDFATALSNGTIPAATGCRVHSFTSVDLTARFAPSKQLELHVSIQNLFDRHAPYDWATFGGAGAPYNPALHQSGAIGRFITVGGSWRF